MLSMNSSVSCLNASRRFVVEVGEHGLDRRGALEIAQLQPLAGEVVDERLRPRIGEHALHLLLEHGRVVQLALRPPASSSSSSGMLLQRKNDSRDASSIVADVGPTGGGAGDRVGRRRRSRRVPHRDEIRRSVANLRAGEGRSEAEASPSTRNRK